MKPQSYELFSILLRNGSGLAIGTDKQYLLESRLDPIMKQLGLPDLDGLADRLRAGAPSIERAVIEAMTTNESFFFRDEKPFNHFRGRALPQFAAVRPATAKLRIWSAASSSGQEAYSLAMIVSECRATLAGRSVEIVGTDLARAPLARAKAGVYSQFEVQRGLPITMLVKYFKKDGLNWQINDPLRAMVSFREWNLLADPRPLGQFDIVFCRNVLIYFDQPTKTRVLDAIARQMPPDGLLYLGGAETVLGITDRFSAVPGEHGVYALTGANAAPSRMAVPA